MMSVQGRWFLMAFVLAFVVRVVFAWVFKWNRQTGDEAVAGLMAIHIAKGQDYPVFFYGQSYFGALEPYLNAVLFSLLGFHPNLIYLLPVLFSTLLVAVEYFWVKKTFGEDVALYSSFVIALVPFVYLEETLFASGGFCLALILEIVVIWQFVVICLDGSNNSKGFLVFCLFSGLLFWVWQLYIPKFVLMLLVWIVVRPKVSLRTALVGTCLFVVASFPLWYYNLIYSGTTFVEVFGKFSATSSGHGITSFIRGFIGNRVWNARYYIEVFAVGVGGGNFVWLAATCIGVALALRSAGMTRTRGRIAVSKIALICCLAIVALVVGHRASRYLMEVPLLLTPVMLVGWQRLYRSLGRVVVLLVAASSLWTIWQAARSPLATPDWAVIVEDLRGNGLSYGYSDFESAYPITFMSNEAIIVSPVIATPDGYRTDRYPAYTAAVNQSPSSFVLVPLGSPDTNKIRALVVNDPVISSRLMGPASTYQLYYPCTPECNLFQWLIHLSGLPRK
jgi:hypothetical protein